MPSYTETVPDAVRRVVDRGYDDICEKLDGIKDASPADILTALKERGEIDLADYYEEWLGDDAPGDPDTHPSTMGEVPDPGDQESYKALEEHMRNTKAARGELSDEPGKVWKLTGPNSVSSPGE